MKIVLCKVFITSSYKLSLDKYCSMHKLVNGNNLQKKIDVKMAQSYMFPKLNREPSTEQRRTVYNINQSCEKA